MKIRLGSAMNDRLATYISIQDDDTLTLFQPRLAIQSPSSRTTVDRISKTMYMKMSECSSSFTGEHRNILSRSLLIVIVDVTCTDSIRQDCLWSYLWCRDAAEPENVSLTSQIEAPGE